MKRDAIDEGRISEESRPLGTVTRDMVTARAREIAVINGRAPHEVIEADWEQAFRDLTGSDAPLRDQMIENLPESERWDPVAGSPGHRAPTVPVQDEQTENERLVQEGMDEAEHDQMLQGSREIARQDEESE